MTGVRNVRISGWREGKMLVTVDVMLRNTRHRTLVVRGMEASLMVGGKEAGGVVLKKKIKIPGEKEALYHVPLEIRLQGVGNALKSLWDGSGGQMHLKGIIKVRSGIFCRKIPFDERTLHSLRP